MSLLNVKIYLNQITNFNLQKGPVLQTPLSTQFPSVSDTRRPPIAPELSNLLTSPSVNHLNQ